MKPWHRGRTGVLAAAAFAACALAPSAGAQDLIRQVNRGVVEIETNSSAGISPRIAEDLANLLDDGATRRVLPVMGKGSMQNVLDLKALRGIDMAIVQADVLDYARTQKITAGLEALTYIAKLYNEEFHLLARSDVKSVDDLAGKKVNFDLRGAGTGVTAERLFGLLKIKVEPTTFDVHTALAKLAKGDIAALAYVAGRPAPLFRDLKPEDGYHLVPIPLRAEVTASYVPTRLTAQDYPGLVAADAPIDTIAVGAVLAAANLQSGTERAQNLANFVDAFFTQFPTLLEPGHHPKWREVNLAVDVPGWRRYPPAEQWLKRNATVASAQPSGIDMKTMFQRFLDERLQVTGGQAMTQRQKDELFGQFERWQAGQGH
jgi:uncharacterized protein